MPPAKPRDIFLMLDVNFPEHRKVRALARFGKDARGCRDLLTQMYLYCKRTTSDGHIPVEEIGIMVYPDSPKNGKRDAERLAEVGLVLVTAGGYFIPGFLDRNKSRAEIEEQSKKLATEGSDSGIFGNHVKWHVNRGVTKPECPHCTSGIDRGDPTLDIGVTREQPDTIRSGSDRSEYRGQRTEITTTVGRASNRSVAVADRSPAPPAGAVADIIRRYVQACPEPPPAELQSKVEQRARSLLAQGYDPEKVAVSAENLGRSGYADLATQLSRDNARAAPVDGKRGTADQRALDHLELAQRLEAAGE
jgi:hypothetical protein